MGYFLDTSAIIEIIQGNNKYRKYLNEEFFTSIFNLYELYFVLSKHNGEVKAKEYFLNFKQYLIKFNDGDLFEASKFKLNNINKNISYTDALGYIVSLRNRVKFLTSDTVFRDFTGVEFVKK